MERQHAQVPSPVGGGANVKWAGPEEGQTLQGRKVPWEPELRESLGVSQSQSKGRELWVRGLLINVSGESWESFSWT